jgi:DNA-binding HxlR family transcriptional regulator
MPQPRSHRDTDPAPRPSHGDTDQAPRKGPRPPKRHPYDQWSPDARALDVVGDKWTLLIVRDLMSGPRRFVELQRMLPGISTEQLRSRLGRMVEQELLTRTRYREVPPRVEYALTERARDLAPVLGALARWGRRWAWSSPGHHERVDIGAILRLAPGLLAGSPRTGVVELAVGDQQQTRWTLTLAGKTACIEQHPAERADARIWGDQAQWVAALSPARELAGLQLSGERELAQAVLTGLAGGESAAGS